MNKTPVIVTSVLPPGGCDHNTRFAFKRLVLEGGEVNPSTLPGLIERALVLGLAEASGMLVGIGAIKRPYKNHRATVFASSGSELSSSEFPFELGWVYVIPPFREQGMSSKLVRVLVPAAKGAPMYATSRTNNARMHSSLERVGFTREELPYPSELGAYPIQLFVCRAAQPGVPGDAPQAVDR